MRRFWETFVGPVLDRLGPTAIVEVGSSQGRNTRRLLEFCRERDAVLHAIDPLPLFDVAAWEEEFGHRFVMHRTKSLDTLSGLGPADAYLLDGDHNWYTVYHELRLIAGVAEAHGRPFPLVLLHDVGWPYGRRDLYYDPDDVPAAFRQPFRRGGLLPGDAGLTPRGLNPDLQNAVAEGGPRNGVLTGVDDFLAERPGGPGGPGGLEFVRLYGFHGLGVVVSAALKAERPAAGELLDQVGEEHRRLAGHLEALERDRIRNLIRVERLKRREDARDGGQGGRGGRERARSRRVAS